MTIDQKIIDDAAAWHVASESDSMDWGGFTDWLEADPQHRLAYDQVALADVTLGESAHELWPTSVQSTEAPPARQRRSLWMAISALAASVALAVGWTQTWNSREFYVSGNQTRMIVLADGSQIALAPNSRLELAAADNEIVLDGGAWFTIRHDPSRSLIVRAGPVQVQDIGTSFDVQTNGRQTRLAVAEGRVRVSSDQLVHPEEVQAGHALTYDGEAGESVTQKADAASIGGWRTGVLSYTDTPLPLVADDLNRYAGVNVEVAQSERMRRFAGTLAIKDGRRSVTALAELVGLCAHAVGDHLRIGPCAR